MKIERDDVAGAGQTPCFELAPILRNERPLTGLGGEAYDAREVILGSAR